MSTSASEYICIFIFPRRYAFLEWVYILVSKFQIKKNPTILLDAGLAFPVLRYALPALPPEKKQAQQTKHERVAFDGGNALVWHDIHSGASSVNVPSMSTCVNSVTCVTNSIVYNVHCRNRGDMSFAHNLRLHAGWRYVRHVLFFGQVPGGLRKTKRRGSRSFRAAESQ